MAERLLVLCGSRDILGDWEAGLVSGTFPVGSNQSASQIIERASKILDNVPGHQAKSIRDDEIFRQTIERLLGLRIALYDDGVWVRPSELVQLHLEVSEVMLGPLCF